MPAHACNWAGSVERLTHAGVKHVMSVAWRPKNLDVLAVAHGSGVCLWSCEDRNAVQARPGAILARSEHVQLAERIARVQWGEVWERRPAGSSRCCSARGSVCLCRCAHFVASRCLSAQKLTCTIQFLTVRLVEPLRTLPRRQLLPRGRLLCVGGGHPDMVMLRTFRS